MITTIIAIIIIFFFTLAVGGLTWALIRLKGTGLLTIFMRGKWLLSILSFAFIASFFTSAIAMLMGKAWATPFLIHTIYGWLVYLWLYNLKMLWDMYVLLKSEKAKSVSQLMGRSQVFDEIIEKSIELSKTSSVPPEPGADAHAVRDVQWEEVLNDEGLFQEVFPIAIRKKMRKKIIGLTVHTIIFLIILAFIR